MIPRAVSTACDASFSGPDRLQDFVFKKDLNAIIINSE